MTPKTVHLLSAFVFALVALMHLWRVLAQAPLTIAGQSIPQAASVAAVIVAGGLSVMNFRSARG